VERLSYFHDGEQWWQAHWTIPHRADQSIVITAQSLFTSSDQARAAAETVVAGFESAWRMSS
jgi:hypothetical protein